MDMGSAKCVKGSSMSETDFGKRTSSHSPKKKKSQMSRPKFYPCVKCGRKFTIRALAVHKQSCSEDADCSCSACKSLPSAEPHDFTIADTIEKTVNIALCRSHSSSPEKMESSSFSNLNEMCVSQSDSSLLENNSLMQLAFVVSQTPPFPIDNSGFQNQEMIGSSNSASSPNFFIIDKNNEQCVSADSSTDISGLLLLHDAGILQLSNVALEPSSCANNVNGSNQESDKVPESNGVTATKSLSHLSETKVEVISGPSSNYAFSDRKLLCTLCNLELPWEVFGNHIVQHSVSSNGQTMKCPKCAKPFTRSAMLLIHFYKHITDCPFICKDCLTLFRLCDDLKNHTLNVHGYIETQPFHCYICMRRFSHPQTIINHMRLHSKETPFKCNECSRSFSQIGNLQRHLSVHRGDRPHKCQDCDKSFADPATLRNHVRIHTGETPFVCKVCLRGFTQVGNLKRHMARHLQARPKGAATNFHQILQPPSMVTEDKTGEEMDESVPADEVEEPKEVVENGDSHIATNGTADGAEARNGIVEPSNISTDNDKIDEANLAKENETAIAMSQLKEQRKKHHWQLFPCPVCGKVYTWQHDLSIHFRIHTGEKPYKCDICDKRFAQSGAVRIHKSRHHNDEDVYVGS